MRLLLAPPSGEETTLVLMLHPDDLFALGGGIAHETEDEWRPYLVADPGRIVVMCNSTALVPGMARIAFVRGVWPDSETNLPRWLDPPRG